MKGKIGLEIHVYLSTREKLFCRCRASREKGQKPNSYVCPICTGQPGAKPMFPNKDAVIKALRIALMFGCEVNGLVLWQRKHYDWPDLPKGYQNTISGAHAKPVGVSGNFGGIRISSMHLEEDPAQWNPDNGFVDYNRSGLPLVEMVTEPDFKSSEEVYYWLKKLVHVLSYLKAVDRDAGIKADVNVNIPGKTVRVEVKNVNSTENVKQAIEYELQRQSKEGSVLETRRYDEGSDRTMRMRLKEEEDDYRFIADPDLQPLRLEKKLVEIVRKDLPDMPETKLQKMIKKYKIDEENATILTKNLDIAEFFEEVVESHSINPSFALTWVTIELLRVLNWNRKELYEVDIDVKHFVRLLQLVKQGRITELQGKQILNKFIPKSFDPSKTEGKIDDKKELEVIAEQVIKENTNAAEDFKAGDKKALNFLMGQVMRKTERRADFKVALAVLKKRLGR